jgi:hypothetical protein
MSSRTAVSWPILEFLDEELGVPPPETEPVDETVAADALYMASCDVFLARDCSDRFTLTLKHRGQLTEVRLMAGVDDQGEPAIIALVNS